MSRVRGTIRDRQTMRSFNMGGILFDFPDPVSPLRPRCSTRYFSCDFLLKTWTLQTVYIGTVE